LKLLLWSYSGLVAGLKVGATRLAAKAKSTTKVGDVSGTKPTTINITIQKQIGVYKLYNQNIKDGGRAAGEEIKQMLTAAVSDASLLVQKQ
jgi:hypothetical protein